MKKRRYMSKLECHLWSVALVAAWCDARGRKEFLKSWGHQLWNCEWRCWGPKYVYPKAKVA